ncbi:MAG: hypothetical protein Rubg2KO_02100 [Rubricoccaceae bacterium]
MRLAITISRYALGVIFFVFGLNGFLNFIPQPPPAPEAGALLGAFVASGYLMALVKLTETIIGALLLANRFVPLALVVLMPITLNIVLFHAFLDPAMPGLFVGVLVFVLNTFLIWAYRTYYAPLKEARAEPLSS